MAEGKIKGITVEIGGNTDPLAKALKEMNKPLNSMQRELKGIESLLKMDPSNVELLRQKEELLNKSIGETESKLEALKKAKDAADKQMANGTKVNREEYRNLVREIASTEQKLDRLTDSMKEFGSVGAQQVKNVGNNMKDIGEKMQNVGGKMSAVVTAPIVGGFALATEGTRELRGDLAKLEANAGQAGKSMELMEEQMTQIVGVTGEVDSSVEGLSNLLASGFSDAGFAEIMDSLSGAAIKFSDTLKFEGIADGLQETLATGAAVGPFAELLERSGLVLDDFNAGLTAAIANGEQENFILQTLASTGLADYYAAYREGNPDLVEAAEAQFRLQTELAKLGELLEPIQTKLTEFAVSILEGFNSLPEGMQNFILILAGVAAAIGPVLVVMGTLISSIGSIITFAPQLVAGLTAVKAAIAAIGGPVTIVIAIITALMLKFIDAYNTSDEFRNKVNAAFNSVKETVSAVVAAVAQKITEFVTIGKNIAEGIWKGISNTTSWLISKVKNWCGSILDGIKAFFGIHSPSKVMQDEIGKQLAAGVVEGIEAGVPDVEAAMAGMSEVLLAEIGGAVDALGNIQVGITPVVNDLAMNSAYAIDTENATRKDEDREKQELYEIIANMFATSLLEGLNYVGNSIFDAIPKILEFYIDSMKVAKTTWDAFDREGNRRNRYFAPTYDEIYRIALQAVSDAMG